MQRIFISDALSPEEFHAAKSMLRKLDSSIRFTDSESDNISVFVATQQEIETERYDHWCAFTITPLCLQQMCKKRLKPWDSHGKTSMINIFLLGKNICILYIPKSEKQRLQSMIERMGGEISDDQQADYILSKEKMNRISSSLIVNPSWIDALYGSETMISCDQFRMETDKQTNRYKRGVGYGRLELKVESPYEAISVPKKEQKMRPISDKLHLVAPSQPSAPKAKDKICIVISDSDVDIEPAIPVSPIKEQKVEEKKPEKPKRKLDDLCQMIMQSKPTKAHEMPQSNVQDDLWSQWNRFSQIEPSQKEYGFDIEYDNTRREPEGSENENDGGCEALFSMFFSQRREQ